MPVPALFDQKEASLILHVISVQPFDDKCTQGSEWKPSETLMLADVTPADMKALHLALGSSNFFTSIFTVWLTTL